jgi:hypothetical protein
MLIPTPTQRSFADSNHAFLPRSWQHAVTLLTVAGALALSGCSSPKTHVDGGRVTGRTFSFVNTGSRPAPGFADNRLDVHQAFQTAITRNLVAKGVNRVETGGDLTVAYLIIVGNNVATTALDEYFGYREETQALVEKVHTEQAVKNKSINYFEAGTLVIDLLDTKTSKLLKRSSLKAPVLRNLAPDARAKRIQSLVDQTLSTVRINQ